MLTIYNTLTKEKAPFKPLDDNNVKMYVCGLTVYDHCHLGHGRTAVAFDMIVRYMRWRGYNVTFIRNITDIDDKIIKRAQENDESIDELVNRYIKLMHRDFDSLLTLRPDIEPRATESMPEIISMIKKLIEEGAAYPTKNGDVYFRVKQFDEYGKLSRQNVDELRTGVRIDPDEDKEDALDFALWKSSKPDEPTWESPWSPGRPGWHIECSVMSQQYLGDTFDIHGGGSDLIFPHHENEIAQSEACTHKPFAKLWMHTGMIRINKEKMSKSLNNFFTINDVLAVYPVEAVRYFLLSGHYRSSINYSEENLKVAKASIERLYTALRGLTISDNTEKNDFTGRFQAVMDDDFNTPEALAVLFELAHEVNRFRDLGDTKSAEKLGATLKSLGGVLGLLQENPSHYLQGDINPEDIDALIVERNQARAEKNWVKSDEIRDKLTAMGIALEDTADGTLWRKE